MVRVDIHYLLQKRNIIIIQQKKYLIANLIVTMGGRAAEKILFNKILTINDNNNYTMSNVFESIKDLDVTSGASGDLKQADKLARKYIELFGYDNFVGDSNPKTIQNPDNPYVSLSENTKEIIDKNVIELVNFTQLTKAVKIIENNLDTFNKLATDLIQKKSVDLKYLDELNVDYF